MVALGLILPTKRGRYSNSFYRAHATLPPNTKPEALFGRRGEVTTFHRAVRIEGQTLTPKMDLVKILQPNILVSCIYPTQKYMLAIVMERWASIN